MAKAGCVSGPKNHFDKRKCTFPGCSGEMELRLVMPRRVITWCCIKNDEHRVRKIPHDYTITDYEQDYGKKEEK